MWRGGVTRHPDIIVPNNEKGVKSTKSRKSPIIKDKKRSRGFVDKGKNKVGEGSIPVGSGPQTDYVGEDYRPLDLEKILEAVQHRVTEEMTLFLAIEKDLMKDEIKDELIAHFRNGGRFPVLRALHLFNNLNKILVLCLLNHKHLKINLLVTLLSSLLSRLGKTMVDFLIY